MTINKRKIKRGALGAVLTAGVLVAVLVLNVLFSWLASEKLLYVDVSKEKFNEISKESQQALNEVDAENTNITIYFLADKDELNSPALGYSKKYTGSTTDLWGMRYVHEMALQFAAQYDYITVEYLNMKDDKDVLEAYKSTVGTTFSKQDVIIDNCLYETDENGSVVKDEKGQAVMHHNFRICNRDAFFTFDEETSYVFAFKGDLRYTSTILSLAGLSPTVYFLTGHGEKVGDAESNDYGKAQALRDLFFEAGFVTRKANLAADYKKIFADTSARILVIYGPESDYTGYESQVNEISLLRKFSFGENRHLMFFIDETKEQLKNLEEYMWDYCGVGFEDTTVKDVGTNDISNDGSAFIARYETDEYSVGINLTSSLTELDSNPKIAFKNAAVLKMHEGFVQSTGFSEDASTKYAGAVFLTPTTAVSVDKEGNTVKNYSESKADPVMVLTYDTWLNSENDSVATYTTICGTTDFADKEYLTDVSYGNRDVLFLAMRLMGKEVVPFEIDFKVVQSEGLEMDETEVIVWEICLIGIIPVAALVLGTVVFIKRRHM